MKNPSRIITRRSFVERSGAIAGSLTLLPGTTLSETNSSASETLKKPFILKKMPEYMGKGTASVRLGMCQVLTGEWAVEENIGRALAAIDQAAAQEAEIAVTPECVFHGYPWDESKGKSPAFRDRLFSIAELPGGERVGRFREKAREKGIAISVGFVEKGGSGSIHNTAALIGPDGEFLYLYRKVHCRDFESIEHTGHFTPGDAFHTASLQFKGGRFRIGTIICFDREIPESLRCIRALGAELVLCPLATDTRDATRYRNEADNEMITRVGSTSNELFIAVVNHAGRFNGGSFITGPKGELFCQMTAEPGVMTVDVPVGIIPEMFHSEPFGWMGWGFRKPEVYKKYL